MDLLKQAAAAVITAEAEIKRLASQAVVSNEWTAVSKLARWAQALRSILESDERIRAEPQPLVVPNVDGELQQSPATTAKQSMPPIAQVKTRPLERGPRTKYTIAKQPKANGKDYPRFVRDADALVKIGWSKKDRSEYEHRAPRVTLDKIVSAITRLGTNKARFSVEEILPLVNASSHREEIPNYQTYLCIAWLRQHALLEQHGRQGYSCASSSQLKHIVDEAWDETPIRQ